MHITHSLIHSLTHSLARSLAHPPCSLPRSLTHSARSLTHSLSRSPTRPSHPCMYLFIHPLRIFPLGHVCTVLSCSLSEILFGSAMTGAKNRLTALLQRFTSATWVMRAPSTKRWSSCDCRSDSKPACCLAVEPCMLILFKGCLLLGSAV